MLTNIFRKIGITGIFLLLFVMFSIPTSAQTWTTNAKQTSVGDALITSFQCEVDSGASFYSSAFGLNFMNGHSSSYELSYGWKLTNATDSQQVAVTLQGSFDATNWKNVDTLLNDSSETFSYSKTYLFGYHFPYYRVLVAAGTRNKNNSDLKLWVYAYHKE